MKHYGLTIRYSNDDEQYVATCPELPGLSVFGSTWVQTALEAVTVANMMLDVLAEDGEPYPEPTSAINGYEKRS